MEKKETRFKTTLLNAKEICYVVCTDACEACHLLARFGTANLESTLGGGVGSGRER